MAALMKFDTLSWAKKLEQAGVPPQQAEIQVELIFRVIDDNICTKQDLRELEGNINIKLKELELKIEAIRRENLGIKSDLELKIEENKRDLGIKIEETRGDLELKIEESKRDLGIKIEETRGDLELKIEETKRDLGIKIEEIRGDLELKIEETRRDLELKIEELRKDLTVALEKVNVNISKQIAKWVLGVSAIQATVLLTLIRFMH